MDGTRNFVPTESNSVNSNVQLHLKNNKQFVHLKSLTKIEDIMLNYLRNFALTSLKTNFLISSCDIEPGIILYGLPGCGKRTLLEQIAKKLYPVMEIEPYYRNLKFIFITPKLFKELYASKLLVYNWLLKQLEQLTNDWHDPLRVVLVWPNLDKFIGSPSDNPGAGPVNHDTMDGEDANETDSNTVKFTNILGQLMDSIRRIQFDPHSPFHLCRFSIVATATLIDKVFDLFECRQLFYRRLLAPLPNAFERYQLLRTNIGLCFNPDNDEWFDKSNQSSDDNSNDFLYVIASQLHGYVPKDLIRLIQVSYAAYLSSYYDQHKDRCANMESLMSQNVIPNLEHFCEILKNESRSYLPVNLSHNLTNFESLHWKDIGGYGELKTLFRTMIQDRLLSAVKPDSANAKADAALGLRVPRGILLHGPPGCSKTMFVRALATECNLPLIAVQASRIFGRYVGDSERNMSKILVQARASAPAILFIDEIDLLLPSRSTSEAGASEHVLGEILTAMDGVEGQTGQVILVAATNRLDKLDLALSRAGRFDLVVEISPPDSEARRDILHLELFHRAHRNIANTKWLSKFAETQLVRYTGAEIVQLVRQAAQFAREDGSNCIRTDHLIKAKHQCCPRSLANYVSQNGKQMANFEVNRTTQSINWHWLWNIFFLIGISIILNYILTYFRMYYMD